MAWFDKDSEGEHLELFLSARESATGEKLSIVRRSESPDFICKRPSGELVGVEHTRIEYNPERTEILEACRACRWDLDNIALFWAAGPAIEAKERKRRKPHWTCSNSTILVLDLAEGCRLEDWPADSSLSDQFNKSGFIEVWISDHSSIEAYGEVTAIGLFPASIWGIRGQEYLWGVPYK
jgi:hypothetical protein